MRFSFHCWPGLRWLLLAGLPACAPSLHVRPVTEAQLPAGLYRRGQLATAVRWADRQGQHLFAVSTQGRGRPTHDDNDGLRGSILLQRYQLPADTLGDGWQYTLQPRLCRPDQEIPLLRGSLKVTDLNRDGIGEVWVVYYDQCRPNGPGSSRRLLMFQGQQTYRAYPASGGFQYGLDSAFLAGPQRFRTFARHLLRGK